MHSNIVIVTDQMSKSSRIGCKMDDSMTSATDGCQELAFAAASRRNVAAQAKTGLVCASIGFLLAIAPNHPAFAQTAPSEGGVSNAGGVETIIVTAEKRSQSALDVPMALTAISGDQLTRHQDTHFEDYVNKIPGLQVTDTGLIGSQLIVRGLSSGSASTSPSTAVYIDDTPYSVQGPLAGSWGSAPNLDTYDMQRIEVLKGPQGTLYGADALGGLLKYVTNAPDPSAFGASVQVGASGVYNANDPGYDLHGMVNIPIDDDLAIRVVGYNTYTPGYIDNTYLHQQGINDTQFYGGRVSVLWQPLSNLTVRLSGLIQDRDYSDFSAEYAWGATGKPNPVPACTAPINCPAGELVLNNYVGQPGHSLNAVASLNVTWDAGPVTVISTTSYSRFDHSGIWDYSGPLAGTATLVMNSLGNPGTYGIAVQDNRPANIWTQELRFVSPEDQTVAWQVGGYFTSETSLLTQTGAPIDTATNEIMTSFMPPYNLETLYAPTAYKEYAVYGNLDYHILPTLDVTAGGRYSATYQSLIEHGYGIFGAGQAVPYTKSHEDVATYSVEASWHFLPENMVYVRTATGFSPGGPNLLSPTATFLPKTYGSESTIDYEIGVKGSLLDDTLTYGVDAFYIDWHQIQASVIISGFSSIASIGDAHSRGFEWDFTYAPIDGLTLTWNGDYTYADLAATTPISESIGAFGGDILPLVARWQTSGSVQYEQPVFADWSGFGSAAIRFTGDRQGDFNVGIFRPTLPAYTMLDFQLGLENDKYSAILYCKNCTNIITPSDFLAWNPASNGTDLQNAAVFMPRTVGVELSLKY